MKHHSLAKLVIMNVVCAVYWLHLKRLSWVKLWLPMRQIALYSTALNQKRPSFMKHVGVTILSSPLQKKKLISVVLPLTVWWLYEKCPALRLCQLKWSHWRDTSRRLTRQPSSATMTFWQKTSSTTTKRVKNGHAHHWHRKTWWILNWNKLLNWFHIDV